MVSVIDSGGMRDWLHTWNDLVRQSRTDAASPSIGSKDDLLRLQGTPASA
jgi:hypothetical protein